MTLTFDEMQQDTLEPMAVLNSSHGQLNPAGISYLPKYECIKD